MRSFILSLALVGLCLSETVAGHDRHRRHHHKRGSGSKCKSHHQGSTGGNASPSGTAVSSGAPAAASGSSTPSSQGSASDDPFSQTDYLSINGVRIGYLPDNGALFLLVQPYCQPQASDLAFRLRQVTLAVKLRTSTRSACIDLTDPCNKDDC